MSQHTNQMIAVPASDIRVNDVVYKEFGREKSLEFIGVVQAVHPLRDSVGIYIRWTQPRRAPMTIHREHILYVVRS